MNRIALAVVAALLALPSASGCAPNAAGAAPERGKPRAPVAIEARLSDGAARVTVRFEADARDVRVELAGSGGLVVAGAAVPLEKASFARGEATAFDVAFTPGPGRSLLSVAVTGKFRGAGRRAAVASFAVGEPTPEQEKASGTVMEGAGGERIKVVVPGR
jgi:hypothetical protein